MKIGVDFDGVIVGKPPIISKNLLESLVRFSNNNSLKYRYPQTQLERLVRIASHHPLLRPPIKENLKALKQLARKKGHQIYLITSRYAFLEKRTWQWLKNHQIDTIFDEVFLNLKNEQPHIFKERKIKKLSLDVYVDDDLPLVEYLNRQVGSKVRVLWYDQYGTDPESISVIPNLFRDLMAAKGP